MSLKLDVLKKDHKRVKGDLHQAGVDNDLLHSKNTELEVSLASTSGKLTESVEIVGALRSKVSGLEESAAYLAEIVSTERRESIVIRSQNFALKLAAIETKPTVNPNPYFGVSHKAAWHHMATLRTRIDTPKGPLSEQEKFLDLDDRSIFLKYCVRDLIKIYINTTTNRPVGAKLPSDISDKLPV